MTIVCTPIAHLHLYAHTHTHVHVYKHRKYACGHTHSCMHTYICTYTHIHSHMPSLYMCACTCTHTHTHPQTDEWLSHNQQYIHQLSHWIVHWRRQEESCGEQHILQLQSSSARGQQGDELAGRGLQEGEYSTSHKKLKYLLTGSLEVRYLKGSSLVVRSRFACSLF